MTSVYLRVSRASGNDTLYRDYTGKIVLHSLLTPSKFSILADHASKHDSALASAVGVQITEKSEAPGKHSIKGLGSRV